MTLMEVNELMKQLRLVFPVVRLVDAGETTVWDTDENGKLLPAECCFAYWGKECRCKNCSSMRAAGDRRTVDKYEILDGRVYHVTSKYLEVEGRDFVLEIVSEFEDKNEIFLLSDAEKERKHVMDILADDFECVDYVDLCSADRNKALSVYRISGRIAAAIPGWEAEHNFRRKMKLAAEHAVVPGDRELFLSETSLPVVLDHLEKENIYFVDFRMNIGGAVNTFQMKFLADRKEDGELIGFVLGCHSIASETKNSLSYKKSAIDSVKNVIPVAFWFEDLRENGRIKSIHYSDEMRVMLGYTEEEFPDTLEALVNIIHPDDRQLMLDAAIAAGTGKSDGYDVEYRILQKDGKYMWANATGQLIRNDNGVPDGMYGAFIDISDHKVKEMDMEIIDVLTSEYTGVYFVNLMTGEATPYSMIESVESEVGDVFQGVVKYSDAYRMCVETLVHDEDKNMMLSAGTVGNIMQELRGKKTFRKIYRDTNGKYCEMKFIKMGASQGTPRAVALCFSEKDEELRNKEEAARRLNRNLDIIGILASEYTSVYYIDMNTDELDTYTMNEETENEFGKVFRAGIKFSSAYRMYVNTFVLPEDRERMLKAGTIYNILDELTDKKTFITGYRDVSGKNCEMKFVKVGDEEYPRAVALGFSSKD